jgi:hypothetical protein
MHPILYHTVLDVHDSRNYGNFEENIKVAMKFGNHILAGSILIKNYGELELEMLFYLQIT